MTEPSTDIRRLRHDLANPLSAVLAEVQLMLLDSETLNGEVVESLKEIERLARRMKDILSADPASG